MPGRFRTASRPSRTWMASAPYEVESAVKRRSCGPTCLWKPCGKPADGSVPATRHPSTGDTRSRASSTGSSGPFRSPAQGRVQLPAAWGGRTRTSTVWTRSGSPQRSPMAAHRSRACHRSCSPTAGTDVETTSRPSRRVSTEHDRARRAPTSCDQCSRTVSNESGRARPSARRTRSRDSPTVRAGRRPVGSGSIAILGRYRWATTGTPSTMRTTPSATTPGGAPVADVMNV